MKIMKFKMKEDLVMFCATIKFAAIIYHIKQQNKPIIYALRNLKKKWVIDLINKNKKVWI